MHVFPSARAATRQVTAALAAVALGAAAPSAMAASPGPTDDPDVVIIGGDPTGTPTPEPTATPSPASMVSGFIPTTSTRLVDTRDGTGADVGPVEAGTTLTVRVAGTHGVPEHIGAAAMNVFITDATADGFATVAPRVQGTPTTSTVNYTPDRPVSNFTISPVADDGTVTVYVHATAHVVVDLHGYFAPSTTYNTVTPARVLDTRDGTGTRDGAGDTEGPGKSHGLTTFKATGQAGVPEDGVAAVVLNVTVTEPEWEGNVQVTRQAAGRDPGALVTTFDTGDTVAALVIAPVADDGTTTLRPNAKTHLIADVVGYIPADAGVELVEGLSMADSRTLTGDIPEKLQADTTADVTMSLMGIDFPPAPAAVAVTVTVHNPESDGFVSLYPKGSRRPNTAAVAFREGQTVTGTVIVPVGDGTAVTVYSTATTDVSISLNAYWPAPSN